jgi:hypothetical protein
MLRIAGRTMRPRWCHSSFETPLRGLLRGCESLCTIRVEFARAE